MNTKQCGPGGSPVVTQRGVPHSVYVTYGECLTLLNDYGYVRDDEPNTFHHPSGCSTVEFATPPDRGHLDEPGRLTLYAFRPDASWHVSVDRVPFPVLSGLLAHATENPQESRKETPPDLDRAQDVYRSPKA